MEKKAVSGGQEVGTALLRVVADLVRADVKVAQARLRHRSAKTTLDVYGHLFPDSDDRTRTAVDAALVRRPDFLRTTEVIA